MDSNRQQGLQQGRQEDRQEGIKETAAHALKAGIDLKTIATITGLTLDEIRKIQDTTK